MTVLALVLLLMAAAAPLLHAPLRRLVADPVLPVASCSAVLLGAAAAVAAAADDVQGWERATAAVLGVLAAVTAGSHVVRAVFRLTRREVWPARAARAGDLIAEPADAGDPGSGGVDPDRPGDRATIAALQASSSRQCDQMRTSLPPRRFRNIVLQTLRKPPRRLEWRGSRTRR